jgi:hypothetical protein
MAFPPHGAQERSSSDIGSITHTIAMLLFGAYCEVHEENTPTNGMTTRGTPAIYLGPTGNFQGTYNFLSLVTGQVI